MEEITSYFTLVCFMGMKPYPVQARNRREAAEKGVESIINDKYQKGEFFQYSDSPILIAVQENPKAKGPLSLYRTEIQGKEERIKEVKELKEVEVFLRSAFRTIREQVKNVNDFKKRIEILMTKMVEEFGPTRR